jgi:hypothetical protein
MTKKIIAIFEFQFIVSLTRFVPVVISSKLGNYVSAENVAICSGEMKSIWIYQAAAARACFFVIEFT